MRVSPSGIAEDDLFEVGKPFTPVVVVAHHGHLVAGDPLLELERARADRLLHLTAHEVGVGT